MSACAVVSKILLCSALLFIFGATAKKSAKNPNTGNIVRNTPPITFRKNAILALWDTTVDTATDPCGRICYYRRMGERSELLKSAIASRVLVRARDGLRIISVASGSPQASSWLFDFRATVLEPKWLDAYAEIFWEKYGDRLPFQVGGMETAALPLVSAIVMKGIQRGTPVNGFYIRKSRDRDGLVKQIEGTLTNDPVILVDDLINSGGSFKKQMMVLEGARKRVADIFALLAFRAPEAYAFAKEKGTSVSWLFTLEDFGLPLQQSSHAHAPQELFEQQWKFSADEPSFEWVVQKSAPVIDDTRVYSGSDKGTFYALNQSNGEIAWQFNVGRHPHGKGIFSSPALHKGTVYFGAYDGCMYALSAESGEKKWEYSDADWIGSSPALAPDLGLVFVGLEFGLFRKRGGIVALDMKSGARKWQDRTPALTHGSPLYIKEEGLVVIGSNDGVVYAYDASSGERSWTQKTDGDVKTRPAYDQKRRLVLVPSMDMNLHALSVRDGTVRWTYQTGANVYSIPLVHDDAVYIASLDKSLYRLSLDTGKKLAEFETSGRIFASPVIIGNSLFLGSNDGRLYELDPETLKSRGSHQFTERIVNAVAYNPKTQRFFVPTVANELYALKRIAPALQ